MAGSSSFHFNRSAAITIVQMLLFRSLWTVSFVTCFVQYNPPTFHPLCRIRIGRGTKVDAVSPSAAPNINQSESVSSSKKQQQQQQHHHRNQWSSSNNNNPMTTASTKSMTKKKKNKPGKEAREAKRRVGNPDYVPPPKSPYHADFVTSRYSQQFLTDAAKNTETNSKTPLECATSVLETFLKLEPYNCNSANVVYALTLSAKTLGTSSTDEYFRNLLFRTNNILYQLLQTKLSTDKNTHPSSLSPRQLCNAVWALGKHYDRDEKILPPVPSATAIGSDEDGITTIFVRGKAEIWDLRDDIASDTKAHRVDKTIDEIASQLIVVIRQNIYALKENEICMACWAYGVLRRRRRPPGWQHTPQISKLPTPTTTTSTKNNNERFSGSTRSDKANFIKFEEWKTSATGISSTVLDDVIDQTTINPQDTTITAEFLDAAAYALTPENNTTTLDVHTSSAIGRDRIRQCSWMELAILSWAFAASGRACSQNAERLINTIGQEATRRLKEASSTGSTTILSRDICQIIWAFGVLLADNFRLGDTMVDIVETVSDVAQFSDIIDFSRWSCSDICQFLLALAHARIDNIFLIDSLYTEACRRFDSNSVQLGREVRSTNWKPWESTVLLWAQARLYLTEARGPIFHQFAKRAVSNIYIAYQRESCFQRIGIGPQEQANLAWSLTVLDQYTTPEAVELLQAVFKEGAETYEINGVIQLEHAHQLWQSLFILQDECPNCTKVVPTWFREYLQQQWSIEKARPKISSARHLSLSKTLNLMGVSHFNEHDEDIDVAIVLKAGANWTHETETNEIQSGIRVAVEFDGPYHFTRPSNPIHYVGKVEPPRALGHTVLKYRLLKKQGWTVVRVPYYEYDKIPFWASMERQRYLQRLLKTHVKLRFSRADGSAYKAQVPNRGSRFD